MPHGDGRGDYTNHSHQRRHPQRSSTVEMEKFAREVNKLLRQTQSSSSQLVGTDRGSVSLPPRSYPREALPPPPQYRTSSHNPHPHTLPPHRVQLLQTSSTPSLHPSHSPSVAYVCYPQHHQPQQPPIGYHYPLYVPSYSPPLEGPLMMMGDPSCHQLYSPQNWTPQPYPSAHEPPNLNTQPLSRPSSHDRNNRPRQIDSCNFLPPQGAPLVFVIAEPPPQLLPPLRPPPSVHEGFSNAEIRNPQRLPTLPCRNDGKMEQKGLPGCSKKSQEVSLRSIGTSTMTPPPLEETDGAESDAESSFHETGSSEGDEEEIQEEAFAFGQRHKVMRSPQQGVRTPLDTPVPAKRRLKIPAVSSHRLKNFRSLSPLEEAPPLSPGAAAELQEKLEQTVILLQDSSWERQFEGLAEFTGHLRSPENFPTIQGIMPRVVSSLTKMIRSTRTRLSIEAIRTARFLFTCLGKRLDHFLCVLGMELFGKTIPAAKFIRDEAEEALQVAIHCCSTNKVMHLLESKAGGRHKHGKVRTVAASLMFILIHDVVGPKEILKSYGKEVLPLLLEWWEEPQVLIRSIANYSLLLFAPFKLDFERAVQNHVNIDVEMRLREKLQKLMNTKIRKRREKSA